MSNYYPIQPPSYQISIPPTNPISAPPSNQEEDPLIVKIDKLSVIVNQINERTESTLMKNISTHSRISFMTILIFIQTLWVLIYYLWPYNC